MKKTISLFLLALLSVTVAIGQPLLYEGVYYTLNTQKRTAQVTAPPSYSYKGELKIVPSFKNTKDTHTYTVTGIEKRAFYNCDLVTNVEIPEGLTTIGTEAFQDCTGLTSITLPTSIVTLGDKAFYGCQKLTSINIPVQEIGKSAFQTCNSLVDITIPNSVKVIGIEAFANCSNLVTVTIGKGVTDIKSKAFGNDRALRKVYCNADVIPNTDKYAFHDMCADVAVLYVPEAMVSQYREAIPWNQFSAIYATGISQLTATSLQVQASDGMITVNGAENGDAITVYNTAGKRLATTTTNSGSAILPCRLRRGNVVLVKVGEKTVKTLVK